MNSGDVDAALAPFTDDVKFAVFEYFASNKDELRGIFDWLAGLETKYQVTECQPKDGGVVCTMPVVDACIAGFGATDGLPTKMEFSFQADGKISKVSGNLEGGEWDNYFSKWVYARDELDASQSRRGVCEGRCAQPTEGRPARFRPSCARSTGRA